MPLFNSMPRQLAVLVTYGWPRDISDEDILKRLLAFNLERAVGQDGAVVPLGDDTDED